MGAALGSRRDASRGGEIARDGGARGVTLPRRRRRGVGFRIAVEILREGLACPVGRLRCGRVRRVGGIRGGAVACGLDDPRKLLVLRLEELEDAEGLGIGRRGGGVRVLGCGVGVGARRLTRIGGGGKGGAAEGMGLWDWVRRSGNTYAGDRLL